MLVQRLDSREVDASQVPGGKAADHHGVSPSTPELEFVEFPNQRLDSDVACIKKQLLSRLHSLLPMPAADFRPALVDHQADRAVWIDLDSVKSLFANLDRSLVQLDLDPAGISHPKNQVALVKLQDRLFLGQLGEEDIGFSGDPDEVSVPQLHFDPRLGVTHDPVAADQGKIEGQFVPVHVAGSLVGGAAVHEADPGRMLPAGRNPRGGKSRNQGNERAQQSRSAPPSRP